MGQITLKELKCYIDCGVKIEPYIKSLACGYLINDELNISTFEDINIEDIKPILYPLSWLKDINSPLMNELNCDIHNQIEISEFANKKMSLQSLSYESFEVLVSNKVDVFNLIPRGLAIEVTEEFNPYLK